MVTLIKLVFGLLVDLFRSQAALEAEILVLRQQIIVLRRGKPTRPPFMVTDKLVLGVGLPAVSERRDALAIVRPETVVRWHRTGFRLYWRWKSRRRQGRPVMPAEIRQLIREMSTANPLWGAPRVHGELLKLGIDIGQTSVAKYRSAIAVTITRFAGHGQPYWVCGKDRDSASLAPQGRVCLLAGGSSEAEYSSQFGFT